MVTDVFSKKPIWNVIQFDQNSSGLTLVTHCGIISNLRIRWATKLSVIFHGILKPSGGATPTSFCATTLAVLVITSSVRIP